MTRILHVLDISLPMLAGYTARSRSIVTHQKQLGLDPVVLTSVRQDNPGRVDQEEIDGVRYYRTLPAEGSLLSRLAAGRPGASELAEIAALQQRVVEVAQAEGVDIIHGHSSILVGLPAYFAARQLGLPFVYEIRAFWEDAAVDAGKTQIGSRRYQATQAAESWLTQRADAVVGICDGIRRELVERGTSADKLFVVPNGVDTQRFTPQARDPALEERHGLAGKTVVGYIGTFAAFEGVSYLIDALSQLIRDEGRDDIRGMIVGSGITYEACRERAAAAGLADKIFHPGRVHQDEVEAYYSVVDIFAYPRDRQRITELVTPLKPLEAMAMEKTVIGSDVGGLTELIQHDKTGLIFHAESASELAGAIRQAADDPALRQRLGAAGRRYVEQERRWRKIIDGHFELYDRARFNWGRNATAWRTVSKASAPLAWLAAL